MKKWQTLGGTYTIEEILTEIRDTEKKGINVHDMSWFLRIKDFTIDDFISQLKKLKEQGVGTINNFTITENQGLSVFKDATIIEGWDAPKIDVTVTQNGITIGLKRLGIHRENNDIYYILSWITEYDPENGGPPCSGRPLYFFNFKEGQPGKEIFPKNEE